MKLVAERVTRVPKQAIIGGFYAKVNETEFPQLSKFAEKQKII